AGTAIVSASGSVRRIAFRFPTPNAYFDSYALNVLRIVYEEFKQQDLVSDLLRHLQQRAEAAAGNKIYDTLALAYVQIWNEDPEAAHKTLLAALSQAPQDDELKLDTARRLSQ